MFHKHGNILIVCSDNSSTAKTYNKQKNVFAKFVSYKFGKKDIRLTFINGNKGQRFPRNVDDGKKYHVIWFAGCCVLSQLFPLKHRDLIKTLLLTLLHPNGCIIYLQSLTYGLE